MLKVKEAPQVAVRIPEWAERSRVACSVNGERQDPAQAGNYIRGRGLKRGDNVAVGFPMREIAIEPYELTIKSNTVIDTSPRGTSIRCISGAITGRIMHRQGR